MRFEKLGKSTLKITLPLFELKAYDIDVAQLTSANEKARRFLSRLVLLGSAECGFCPSAEKYAIEVFLCGNICIIYISSIECGKKPCESIIMCKTQSLEDMAALCVALCAMPPQIACKTSLYSGNGCIILIAKCPFCKSQKLEDLCSEFGKTQRISRIELASLCERCGVLFKTQAAQSLCAVLKPD